MQYDDENKPFVIGSPGTSSSSPAFAFDDVRSTPAAPRPPLQKQRRGGIKWTLGLLGVAGGAAVFLFLGTPRTLPALLHGDRPSVEEFAALQESHRALTKLHEALEKDSSTELSKLQGKLRAAEADLLKASKAGQGAASTQDELKTARARIEDLTRRQRDAELKLKDRDQRISQLQTELQTQKAAHDKAEAGIAELTKRETAAVARAEALASQKQEAEARIRTLEADKQEAVKLARDAAEVAEVSKEMAARAAERANERCRSGELSGLR